MPNLSLELFDKLMELPDDIREVVLEGYDLAETLEQEIALGYLKLWPKFVYNGGRQYRVLAIWE